MSMGSCEVQLCLPCFECLCIARASAYTLFFFFRLRFLFFLRSLLFLFFPRRRTPVPSMDNVDPADSLPIGPGISAFYKIVSSKSGYNNLPSSRRICRSPSQPCYAITCPDTLGIDDETTLVEQGQLCGDGRSNCLVWKGRGSDGARLHHHDVTPRVLDCFIAAFSFLCSVVSSLSPFTIFGNGQRKAPSICRPMAHLATPATCKRPLALNPPRLRPGPPSPRPALPSPHVRTPGGFLSLGSPAVLATRPMWARTSRAACRNLDHKRPF